MKKLLFLALFLCTNAFAQQSASITQLRSSIDAIDEEILVLVSERQKLAALIGQIKKEQGAPVLDSSREKQVVQRMQKLGADYNSPLSSQQIADLWMTLMLVSKQAQ
jgi:monofunctional chorismate mutase